MIDLRVIYELYTNPIKKELVILKQEYKNNLKYKRTYFKYLKDYKNVLNKYSNSSLDKIKKFNSNEQLNTLSFKKQMYVNGKEINTKALKLYLVKYTYHKCIANLQKKEIDRLKNTLPSYIMFNFIISNYNDYIINIMIEENAKFELNTNFGYIGVEKVIIKDNKTINWGASNKKKKQLLAQNKEVYSKENPEGEHWFVTFPDVDYFLYWKHSYSTIKYNPILKDYKYKPARGSNSIVTKLSTVKKDTNKAAALYKELK